MVSKTFLIVFGGVTLLGLCACCLLFWKLRKLRKRQYNAGPTSNAAHVPGITFQPASISAQITRYDQNFTNSLPPRQPPYNPYSEPPPPYESVVNNKLDPIINIRPPQESELWFVRKKILAVEHLFFKLLSFSFGELSIFTLFLFGYGFSFCSRFSGNGI